MYIDPNWLFKTQYATLRYSMTPEAVQREPSQEFEIPSVEIPPASAENHVKPHLFTQVYHTYKIKII